MQFNETGSVEFQGIGKYLGSGIVVDQRGIIFIVGFDYTASTMMIWRYTSDGSLDSKFNSVGYANHPDAIGLDVQLDADGDLLVAGADYGEDELMRLYKFALTDTLYFEIE